LLGMTADASDLAGGGLLDALLARTAVWLVARGAIHRSRADAMGVRLVAERGDLRRVTRGAECELLFDQQVIALCVRRVNRVAGQAVDRGRIRVHAVVPRDAIGRLVVAAQAGLVRACAAARNEDLFLVTAAVDVRGAAAVARLADGIRDTFGLRM